MARIPSGVAMVARVLGWVGIGLGCAIILGCIPIFLLVRDLMLAVVVLEMGGMTITNGVLLLLVAYLMKD